MELTPFGQFVVMIGASIAVLIVDAIRAGSYWVILFALYGTALFFGLLTLWLRLNM